MSTNRESITIFWCGQRVEIPFNENEVHVVPSFLPFEEGYCTTTEINHGDSFSGSYKGNIKNGMPHGKGFYRHSDGTTYDGDWKDGVRDGKGVITYSFGDTYKGNIENGMPHGKGVYRFSDGTTYDGYWKDGVRDGKGVITYSCGATYKGNWKYDKQHGKGVYRFSNGTTYDGYWKAGVRDGKGVLTYFFGDTYDGNWKDGRKHGKGVQRYSDGTTCDGNWKDGKKHGDCKITKSGYFFEGVFKYGKKHGYGTEIKSNGEKYMGMWSDDKYNGKGFYQYRTGVSYTGSFKNGSPCGKGTMFRRQNVIWKQGNFVGGYLHGQGTIFHHDGTIDKQGKFIHGNWFDEVTHAIQKYIETKNKTDLRKVTATELKSYMVQRWNIDIHETLSKQKLMERLNELCNETVPSTNEEGIDIFGNVIQTPCVGNDENIYDVESMFYLFQKDNNGEYVNIPYVYNENGERVPKFPTMGNGKTLENFEILV